MLRPILPTVALALVLAVPAGAAEKVTKFDRFQLWNACGPLSLVVQGLPDNAGKIGLRKEDTETTTRSRLRGARIYGKSADPYLYVNVNVVGPAFALDVEFRRRVRVSRPFGEEPKGADPLTGYASTWRAGGAGTHGGDASYVLSSVSRYVDKFIDEYLRVNADSCRNSN